MVLQKISFIILLYLTTAEASCKWYGTSPFCSTSTSTCTDKYQVVSQTSSSGDGKRCWSGHKTKCCDPQLVGCNGKESYCKLPFDQATFAGTHNSAAGFNGVLKYGSGIAAVSCWYRCQDISITYQMRFGIRFFDLDLCYHKGTLKGCHKDAYAGTLAEILKQMADFLNDSVNRKQVAVIRLSDMHGVTSSNSYLVMNEIKNYFTGSGGKTGLNDYHHRYGRWPTLQQAVDENKRVFVFTPSDICTSSCFSSYPFLINENTYMGDTWQTRKITSSCSGIVGDTRSQCESKKYKTFILDSNFGSSGICTWDMAGYCDNWLKASVDACAAVRKTVNKAVNFLAVDFPNKAPSSQSVVKIANEQNDANVRRLGL